MKEYFGKTKVIQKVIEVMYYGWKIKKMEVNSQCGALLNQPDAVVYDILWQKLSISLIMGTSKQFHYHCHVHICLYRRARLFISGRVLYTFCVTAVFHFIASSNCGAHREMCVRKNNHTNV